MSRQKNRVAKLEGETGIAPNLWDLKVDDLVLRGEAGDKDALLEACRMVLDAAVVALMEHPQPDAQELDSLRAQDWFEDEVALYERAMSISREALLLFVKEPLESGDRIGVCMMESAALWKQLRELRNSRVFIREFKKLYDQIRPALLDCPACLTRLDEGYQELLKEHPGLDAA